MDPLKAQFLTKVWHPNVSSVTGVICLDILKDKWAATYSLRTVLLSIQSLFASPEPSDPQDAVVAGQYIRDRAIFDRTARFWTQHYAAGPGENDADLIKAINKVKEQAENKEHAIVALSCNDWDVTKALNSIKP